MAALTLSANQLVWMAVPAYLAPTFRQLLSALESLDANVGTVAPAPESALSQKQELEARQRDFRGRSSLHLTAQSLARGQGLILINGRPIRLPRRALRLLTRLVVGLVQSDDGFVYRGRLGSGGGLIDEGYYSAASMEQILSELRNRIAPVLDVPPTQFIETADCRVRISLPRGLVTWDAGLSGHPDAKVRECAALLTQAASPSPAIATPAPGLAPCGGLAVPDF